MGMKPSIHSAETKLHMFPLKQTTILIQLWELVVDKKISKFSKKEILKLGLSGRTFSMFIKKCKQTKCATESWDGPRKIYEFSDGAIQNAIKNSWPDFYRVNRAEVNSKLDWTAFK